jgi:hypothetical protein
LVRRNTVSVNDQLQGCNNIVHLEEGGRHDRVVAMCIFVVSPNLELSSLEGGQFLLDLELLLDG